MLDGVKTQYDLNFSLKNWPRAVPPVATDLHFIFSFCSIPLKICHRLRGSWGQGPDPSSQWLLGPIPVRATIFPRHGIP